MSAPAIDVPLEASESVALGGSGTAVFFMVGEHDTSTIPTLTCQLARLIGEDDSNLVIDLSGVTFMDVSVVNLLVRTGLYLRGEARQLLLRAPSLRAQRVLDLCESVSPMGLRFVCSGQLAEPSAA